MSSHEVMASSQESMASSPTELCVARIAHSHWVLGGCNLSGFQRTLVAEYVATVPTVMLLMNTDRHIQLAAWCSGWRRWSHQRS